MTDYGYCYNSTGSKCSGGPQPGTLSLRAGVRTAFPIFGDLGIYNCRPSSGGGGLSTHGEGRGWDCKANAHDPAQKAAGDHLADLLVKHATKLGIQRIIWNRRQWDTRNRTWRIYYGQSPHTDHLHIELCWAAAKGSQTLTTAYVYGVLKGEEDDMAQVPQEEWDDLKKTVEEMAGAVTTMAKRVEKLEIRTRLNHTARTIGTDVKKLADLHPPVAPVPDDE